METTFSDWRDIYMRLSRYDSVDAALRRLAYEKMLELASTFDEVLWKYDYADEQHSSILAELVSLAATLDEWGWVCALASKEGESTLIRLAIKKMLNLAITLADYVQVYYWGKDYSDLEERILKEVDELEAPFCEWKKMRDTCDSDSMLEEIAIEKMLKAAAAFDEWDTMYVWFLDEEEKLEKAEFVVNKMIEQATTLDQCLRAREATSIGSDLEKLIDKRIIDLATTPDELLTVYRRISDASDLKSLAASKIIELATTPEDLIFVYEKSPGDKGLKELAASKIIELAANSEWHNWENICKIAPKSSNIVDFALEEMAKQAKTFNEWKLIYSYASANSKIRALALSELAKL